MRMCNRFVYRYGDPPRPARQVRSVRLGAVRRGQTHMHICSSRHHLILVRSFLGNARRWWNERHVVVAAEEEWDGVARRLRREYTMRCGHKYIVWKSGWHGEGRFHDREQRTGPSGELITNVDDECAGDDRSVQP